MNEIQAKPLHVSLATIVDRLPDDGEYYIGERRVDREEFMSTAMPSLGRALAPNICEVLDPRGEFLAGKSFNRFSQFGEDGLIAAALDKIGTRNRWCFEVGAGDGIENSNTKALRDAGWLAVLIEADRKRYLDCVASSEIAGRVRVFYYLIMPDSLDKILAAYGAPLDLDFGVIDIDGQDWHVFEGLKVYRPRLLLVEYNIQDSEVPPLGGPGQAGLSEILALGKSKGYTALCRTNCNVLFCAEEALP